MEAASASPSSSKFARLRADASEERAIKSRARREESPGGLYACLSSCCRRTVADPLLDAIASGAIAALKGSWLVALRERGGAIRSRHEMPTDAFWSAVELRRLAEALGDEHCGLLFVAFSPSPDPEGELLTMVAQTAKLYLGRSGYYSRSAAEKSPLALAFIAAGLGEQEIDFALFWDYASLHEAPKTAAEERLRERGLRVAHEHWFTQASFVVWLADERLAAGHSAWTLLERTLSSACNSGTRLDLSRRTADALRKAYGGEDWSSDERLDTVCAATRLPPCTPEAFASEIDSLADVPEQDRSLVLELQRAAFGSVSTKLERLEFGAQGWRLAEMRTLCDAAPRLSSLRSLNLSANPQSLVKPGAAVLSEALKGEGRRPCGPQQPSSPLPLHAPLPPPPYQARADGTARS